MYTSPEKIVGCLQRFVGEVLANPIFRRRLRYRPQDALNDFGLSGAVAPSQLPVRHYTTIVTIDQAHIFGSRASLCTAPPLDLRLVAYGAKPMALISGPEEYLAGLRRWAEGHSLVALLSPHQFLPIADEGKGGYCNLTGAQEPARAGSGSHRRLLVASDQNQVMLGWLSLLFGWDDFLARLLGYPDCCSKAFAMRWPQAAAEHQGDLSTATIEASAAGPFDWRYNIFGRYFGREIVQHFPCNFQCAETLRIANRVAASIELFEPSLADSIQETLNSSVLYTERKGVFIFPRAQVKINDSGDTMVSTSRGFMATQPDGALADCVRQTDWIATLPGNGSLKVGAQKIEGRLIQFTDLQTAN